jgi:Type II secretion system (T2SS), protein E, N-terminal domain
VTRQRIGELLVGEGLLSEQAVNRALGFQRMGGSRAKLGTILLTWDLLGEEGLLSALAKHHGCPAAMWPVLSSAPMEIVLLLPAAHAIRLGAIPFDAQQGLIRVAFVDPSNLGAVDEVTAITGRRVLPAVTSEVRLLQAHQMFYGRHLPMEMRTIVQRLDRRITRSSPASRDFRSPDLVAAERLSNPPTIAPAEPANEPVAIPILSSQPELPGHAQGDFELAEMPPLPELAVPPPDVVRPIEFPGPEPEAASSAPALVESFPEDSSGDSLSEWVGEALAAFTGDTSPRAPAAEIDASPAGVEEPALYGREDTDGISDPWAYAAEAEGLDLASAEALEEETDPLTDAHRRGVPQSIPPFRRAGDPVEPFTTTSSVSPLDRDADVVAGMWQPAPDVPVPMDPWWEGRAESPAAEARTRDEIAESVLGRSLASVPRVILLGAGRTGITGWRGRGPGLTPDVVASIRVSHAEISIFSAVQESGVPHFGATDRSEWPRGFAQRFGGTPLDCAIFPIRVLDGTAAFLYADRLGSPMKYEDFALIARASATAAGMLSRFLLDPQRPGHSVRT